MIALGRSRNELDAVVGPAASARRLTVLPRGERLHRGTLHENLGATTATA